MTLTPQPQMMTMTYTPAGTSTVYNVTDPTGFAAYGQPAVNSYHGTQHQYSVFFGDSWKLTDRLTLEGGGRWEAIRYDIYNQTWLSSPFAGAPFANPTGGVDGNPATLYDNGVSSAGPVLRTRRNYSYFNFSLAADYDVSPDLATYIRYTSGKKAPDFGGIQGINTPGQIATQFDAPQKIQQVEVGIKYNRGGINVQLFPFYSLLQNVNVPSVFTYSTGPRAGQQYVEPAFAGKSGPTASRSRPTRGLRRRSICTATSRSRIRAQAISTPGRKGQRATAATIPRLCFPTAMPTTIPRSSFAAASTGKCCPVCVCSAK
jgi:outer membrane receptor protein involved in Fe transport